MVNTDTEAANLALFIKDTWITDVMDWTANQLNTNQTLIRESQLSPYLAGNMDVYKCPANHYLAGVQSGLGWPKGRVRSYSMNAFFGPYSTSMSDPWATTGGNEFFTMYRQWLKLSSVPRPSNYFVTIDEHPDSINDGYF